MTVIAQSPITATGSREPVLIHVPTPGDHYSPQTGSAIITIINQMAKYHAQLEGESYIAVTHGTNWGYEIGKPLVSDAAARHRTNYRRYADQMLAHFGLPRRYSAIAYAPIVDKIEETLTDDFDGAVLIHNSIEAIPYFDQRLPKARVCLWAHNDLLDHRTHREIARTADHAHRVICCSHYIAKDMARHMPGNEHKVRVVQNAADTDLFRPSDIPSHAVPNILAVGRILPEKGIDLLIKACLVLKQRGTRFLLRVVGSTNFSADHELSDYERHLRTIAEPLGDCVSFSPFVDREHIVGIYQSADIGVVPSNWDDPCPLVVAEGLACGLPMVVSRRGGIPELARDAALYFDPPNVHDLANTIAILLEDRALRLSMATQAREVAVSNNWESRYQQLRRALNLTTRSEHISGQAVVS